MVLWRGVWMPGRKAADAPWRAASGSQESLTTLQRSAQQAATAGGPPLLFWLFQTVQWLSPEVGTLMVTDGRFRYSIKKYWRRPCSAPSPLSLSSGYPKRPPFPDQLEAKLKLFPFKEYDSSHSHRHPDQLPPLQRLLFHSEQSE